MTITEIVQAFGQYYLNHGQNLASIYQQMKVGFKTGEVFTQIVTDNDIWRASESRHSRVVQAFQKAFTPTGSLEFKPVEIRQFRLKADLKESPDDIMASWLGFLGNTDVLERKDWPLIKFWITQITEQIQQDLELNEIGRGVHATPTSGVASAAGTAMDGIQTIINKHIAAGRTTPFALGALPTDKKLLVEYLEDFHGNIPKKYWGTPMTIYGPESLVLDYKRGYREVYGKDSDFQENADGTTKIKYTNLSLAGLPSMNFKANGSENDRIFCTPKWNAIMLSKSMKNAKGLFDVQPADREVKLMSDWSMGVGVIIPEIVFCNDGAA